MTRTAGQPGAERIPPLNSAGFEIKMKRSWKSYCFTLTETSETWGLDS